jgi:hypothetical protein
MAQKCSRTLCWVIWHCCAVVSNPNWHWPLSECLVAGGVVGMMLLSKSWEVSSLLSWPQNTIFTDWHTGQINGWCSDMMSGQGGPLSNVQPVSSLFPSWLELHLWWLQIYSPFVSIPLMASRVSSPRVCDSRCVKPNSSSQNSLFRYKIWQTPEAGHYQCYLLIHPQLMKYMLHSE